MVQDGHNLVSVQVLCVLMSTQIVQNILHPPLFFFFLRKLNLLSILTVSISFHRVLKALPFQ